MLKLHLYKVCRVGIAWHVGQPVVGVQLAVLPANGFLAESSVAAGYEF
jgi:hypothetical protein